jgi:hypothetical protein
MLRPKEFLAATPIDVADDGETGLDPIARRVAIKTTWMAALLRAANRLWRRLRPSHPLVLRNPDAHVLARPVSAKTFCASLGRLAGIYWQAQELRDLKAQNLTMLCRCGKDGRTVLEHIDTRLARAERYERKNTSNRRTDDHAQADVKSDPSCSHGTRPTRQNFRDDHGMRIAASPCLVCGTTPSQPHPIRTSQGKSRFLAVPLCVTHANQLAAFGCDEAWWRLLDIDPIPIALSLWQDCVADGAIPQPTAEQ